MPHQQNPERGPADGTPGGPERPRTPGHRTATPDAPELPRQRHQTPSRPPANATPPRGRPATPRPTPPGGMPASARPAPDPGARPTQVSGARPTQDPGARPTQVMPGAVGPAAPMPARPAVGPDRTAVASASAMQGNVPVVGAPAGGDAAPGGPGGGRGPDAGQTTVTEKKHPELGFSKVAAGAGAAIVTAVLGSFLGAVGTILGAALGSIITTVATTFFQKSIEHTRDQVVDKSQKLRERTAARGGPRTQGAAAWQAASRDGGTGVAGPGAQETVRIDPTQVGASAAPAPSGSRWRLRKMSRKSVLIAAGGALLTFVVAMFLVTGVEWIKGSTITGGGSGTSIGNVVSGTSTQQQNDDTSGSGTSTSESSTSTSESDSNRSGDPSSTSQNDGGTSGSTSTSNPLRDGLNRVLPTQGNESGQRQSGQDGSTNGNGNSGGGANSSN